jgi:hypothetical protein
MKIDGAEVFLRELASDWLLKLQKVNTVDTGTIRRRQNLVAPSQGGRPDGGAKFKFWKFDLEIWRASLFNCLTSPL